MRKILFLWRLELKRTVKMLPSMFCFAAALLAVTAAVAYGAGRLLYREAPVFEVTVAVVEEEKNPLTEFAINYIQGMESISEICRFLTVTEKEGFSMLQDGRAAALLVLPDSVIEGIMNGENRPVQVYFPDDAGIESALLKELTDAGVRMLRVAQAQIYGIYDTAREYDVLEGLAVLEGDIDSYNLAFALERLALFTQREVSATEKLSVFEYAAASGVLFFLLLLGMACYPMMRSDPAVMERQLMRGGIGIGAQCFGKWLCGLCGMGAGFGMFLFVAKGIMAVFAVPSVYGQPGRPAGAGLLLFVLLCITTFAFMIIQLAGNGTAAILILFAASTIMLYFSGGFVPMVLLPETVQRISRFLPTTYLVQAVGCLFSGRPQGRTIRILILFHAAFAAVAYGAAVCRIRKGARSET